MYVPSRDAATGTRFWWLGRQTAAAVYTSVGNASRQHTVFGSAQRPKRRKNVKDLNIRTLKHRHICSVRGCGNKDTVMVARSSDLAGGLFLCRDCVEELYRFYFPYEREKYRNKEVVAEAVAPAAEEVVMEAVVPEGKAEKPAVRARTGTKSGAKGASK
jgi:hypothetical protein